MGQRHTTTRHAGPPNGTDWNRSAEQLHGSTAGENVGLPVKALVHPDQDDRRQTSEFLLARGDGLRRIPVETSGTRFDLGPTGAGSVHDITAKERSEETLRQATAATILANRTRARRDAVVLVSLFVLFMLVSNHFGWVETLAAWFMKFQNAWINEAVVALRLLVLLWVVYAFRRGRDSAIEVSERLRAEGALRELQDALESRVEARTKALGRANDGLQVEIGRHAVTLDDLRHREAELKESQRIAGIGSWEWTIATGEIVWSDGLNILLGRDCGLPAPTFETLPQFFTPESWERLAPAIARTVETGVPYELELEEIRADGTTCWTTTRGEAIRGADGAVVKLRGILHDITVRKQSDDALRLESAALNAAADAIVITDRQGTIQWINPAFEAMTGYSTDEAIGKNPQALQKSGVHDQAFYKDLWDTVLGGRVWRGEMTNRRRDGSLYPEDMVVTPVKDARGDVTHFVAIKRDLTKEKEAEAKFLQAQKMEIVGRLAGGIAHDFNNLLTVINGTAELALMDLREGDPQREDFEEIYAAGVRATSLTRQLLAFSRQDVVHVEVLDLNHQVAGLRSMLKRLIGEDIRLVVQAATDGGGVKADPGRLEQVVMNLVVNAKDAMPNGGALTITTENVELDPAQAAAVTCECLRPGPYVRLAIRDTGTGMDEGTRHRIFEPFFTTKVPGKGTGLGLATVYGIVTQSGGGISVDSELGRGSTFNVYLPRVADVTVASEPALIAPAAEATETILVVEDEDGVRHLAQRMLESFGYTVLVARDAAEALSILKHHETSVQLLFTDVVMPGMSGPELGERVASIRPELKVLFSSGHIDNVALRDGVFNNNARFIGKPYRSAEMRHKIRETLDSAPRGAGTLL